MRELGRNHSFLHASWQVSDSSVQTHITATLLDALGILFCFSGSVRSRASSSLPRPSDTRENEWFSSLSWPSSPAVQEKQHWDLFHPQQFLSLPYSCSYFPVPQSPLIMTSLTRRGWYSYFKPQEWTFSQGLGFYAFASNKWSILREWVTSYLSRNYWEMQILRV